MTDFPRGWTLTAIAGAGGSAQIALGGISGLGHVLDSFSASIVSSAVSPGFSPQVTVDLGAGAFTLGLLALPGGAVSRDSDSGSGLDLLTPTAGAMTVAFNAANPAGYTQLLVIQGHDI